MLVVPNTTHLLLYKSVGHRSGLSPRAESHRVSRAEFLVENEFPCHFQPLPASILGSQLTSTFKVSRAPLQSLVAHHAQGLFSCLLLLLKIL